MADIILSVIFILICVVSLFLMTIMCFTNKYLWATKLYATLFDKNIYKGWKTIESRDEILHYDLSVFTDLISSNQLEPGLYHSYGAFWIYNPLNPVKYDCLLTDCSINLPLYKMLCEKFGIDYTNKR